MKMLKNTLYSIDDLKSTFGLVRKEDVVGLIEAWMGECKSTADEMSEDHSVQTHIEAIIFVLSKISGALDDS